MPGGSCFARHEGETLTFGNTLFAEVWSIGAGFVRRISAHLVGGGEWFAEYSSPQGGEGWTAEFSAQIEQLNPCERESYIIRLTLAAPDDVRVFTWQVFEDTAGSILIPPKGGTYPGASQDTQVKADGLENFREAPSESAHLALPSSCWLRRHSIIKEVQFIEQSDVHSEFVFHREWQIHPSEQDLRLKANLICAEDPRTGEGMVFLLLAPSRLVREAWSPPFDFRFFLVWDDQGRRSLHLETHPGQYPLACLFYQDGELGRSEVLTRLQRNLHRPDHARDGLLLSNTWGDRSRADRLNVDFVSREIRAAAEFGVEVVQIDDGWQNGRSANTSAGGVWNSFWEADQSFWEVDKTRFPQGLDPLRNEAQSLGLSLGLWFAPDSSDELRHWRKDAETILALWRKYGVRHFKLDAVKLTSRLAEDRFARMLRQILSQSHEEILLDLDATAEARTTYWGHPQGSVVFLQNRYTDMGNYYPHQTLRALWSLSRYIVPDRLRMEFLNPERNIDVYEGDPLRPSAYPVETLFAITMPSSPLAWLENSGLCSEHRTALNRIITIWKAHRRQFASGTIMPIGSAPNGWSWTGFLSVADDRRSCYALIFRELSERKDSSFPLPKLSLDSMQCAVLAGSGEASCTQETLSVTISAPLQFVFVKLA